MNKKCEIHGVHLKKDTVEIHYGMPASPPAGFDGSRESDFPNANTSIRGGCLIGPDQPETRSVKYCPQCRVAEKEWIEAQESPEDSA